MSVELIRKAAAFVRRADIALARINQACSYGNDTTIFMRKVAAHALWPEKFPEPEKLVTRPEPPGIPMLLCCPSCGARHIDEGEFETRVHHTHACQLCGMVWRPAIQPTVGVRFLPGFKDPDSREQG